MKNNSKYSSFNYFSGCMGIHQPGNREVRIYPLRGERGITRRVSQSIFLNLVNSDAVVGYTVPLFGPAIIVMAPGTKYDNDAKKFIPRK